MDIFLVPVPRDRYELYCEVETEGPAGDEEPSSGWMRRQVRRFRAMMAEAEEERVRRERGEASETRGLTTWVVGKIAETVAEQRLLWHLRHETAARLVHPADRDGQASLEIARHQFAADYAKHRRWLLIDVGVTAVTGPIFFFVPGPNVISWFFAFRALGHYYALRGARHAMAGVAWTTEPSPDLASLRGVLGLDLPERRARLEQIAEALGLKALPGFVERVARSTRGTTSPAPHAKRRAPS